MPSYKDICHQINTGDIVLFSGISAGDTLSTLTEQLSGKGLNSGSCGTTFVIDQWGKSIQTELRS